MNTNITIKFSLIYLQTIRNKILCLIFKYSVYISGFNLFLLAMTDIQGVLFKGKLKGRLLTQKVDSTPSTDREC